MKRLISMLLLVALLSGMIVIPSPTVADTPQNVFVPQIKLIAPQVSTRGTPMSTDGRFTVFESSADDLVENDTNGYPDIFVYDKLSDNITRVNVSSAGEEANFGYTSELGYPAISADGRYVAFGSWASNLVPEDTDTSYDIFVHDLQSGNTTLASVNSDGIKQDKSSSYRPVISMSANGRYITFNSPATNLAEGISGQYPPEHVYVHDMQSGNTTLVSVSTDGVVGDSSSTRSRISADGRYIVFQSFATNLVEGDANDTEDIFVHDMVTGVTTRVSVSSSGEEADGRNTNPIISGNGRYVYYVSEANNLVPDDVSIDREDVFAYDMETGDTTLINKNAAGLQARGDDWFISTSFDGRYVVMTTDAWVSGDWGTGAYHEWYYIPECVFVRDMETASITQVSLPLITSIYPSWSELKANGSSYAGTISADGNYVSFISYATNLIPDDPYGRGSKLFYAYLDREPPTWPEDSSLRAENVGQTMLTLNWDPAEDEGRIYLYRLYQNDVWFKDVSGSTTSDTVSDLSNNTEYTFRVEAIDGWQGNQSEDGPSLTVKTQAPEGTAVLRVEAMSGGTAYLYWDPAGSGATGFRIYRSGGGQSNVLVGSVDDVNTLTFRDTGLTADTTYSYQIFTVDGGGSESPHTAPVEVTTSVLQEISGITWRAPKENRLAILGESAGIAVYGEANRQVEVEVTYKTWYDDGHNLLSEPGFASATVVLSQYTTDSGQYHGDFLIEDGITEIRALSANLSDGAGHSVTRDMSLSPYERVGGAIVVDVIAGAESLEQTKLIAWSDIAGTGTELSPTGSGTYVLPGLKTANDYAVRILRDDGRVLAAQYNVAVTAGLETNLSMAPQSPAWVHLQVQNGSGTGIENALVTFNDAVSGEYLGWNRTDNTGWLTDLDEMLSDDVIKATVRAELPYSGTSAELTLEPGENTIVLQVNRLAEGFVSGNVTEPGGTPVPGAVVTASQIVDGKSFNRRTTTGANGAYGLTLFEGQARIEATSPVPSHSADIAEVTISSDNPVIQDFVLDSLGTGTISIVINTDFLGEDARPLDMDWPTVLKFNVRIDGAVVNGSGYPISIRGNAGASVNVTIDGGWCNLPKVTQTVVLDEYRSATATFNLMETGAQVQGRVVYASGDGAGGWYTGTFLESDGRWTSYPLPGSGVSGDESLEIGVREPGHYQFRIEPPQPWPQVYQALGQMVPVTIFEVTVTNDDIASGRIFDQGDIYLEVDRFTDTLGVTTPGTSLIWQEPVAERSSFTASRQYIAPGSQLTYRTTYHNIGGLTCNDVSMSFDIPRDTVLIPGSITVNNIQVSGNATGNTVNIPLGTILPGDTGVVYYQVRLPADMGAQTLVSTATMRWRAGTSIYELEESLGRAEVEVIGITLDVPKMTASSNIALSGRAPTGESTVRVYDQNVLLGEAPVSEGGFWKLDVELPFTGSPSWHRLHAVMESYTYGNLYSKKVNVFYDPEQPEVEKIVIAHLRDYNHVLSSREIIPAAGIARFPIAFHVGEILKFELTFDRPEIIGEVKVRMQGTGGGTADAIFEDGVFRAYIEIGEGTLGPISYSYKKKPSAEKFKQPLPSEEELRWQMPYPAREFEIDYNSIVQADSPNSQTGSMDFIMGNFNCSVNLTMERDLGFMPSQEEIELAETSGIPVYRLSVNYPDLDPESDNLMVDFTAWIPEDAVEESSQLLAMKIVGINSGPVVNFPASVASTYIKITGNWVFQGVSAGSMAFTDMFLDVRNIIGVDGNFEKFEEMLERINENCDECLTCAEQLQEKLDALVWRWAIYQIIGQGMNVAALGLAPETFGLSLTLFGVKTALGLSMDYNIGELTQMLSDEINTRCPPDDPEEEPAGFDEWDWPVADPVWLIDPSGYVYEAITENRLEGVTATLLYQDPNTNDWTLWDADWFGQMNPLTTDAEGKYAWDVPEGNWKVIYEKAGYITAFSDVLPVPPPQLDVNIGMVSLQAPEVTSVEPLPGGTAFDITFNKYVRASTLTGNTVNLTLEGTNIELVLSDIAAISPVSFNSSQVSKAFRVTPQEALTVGDSYVLGLRSLIQSYSGIPMVTDFETGFVVPEEPPQETPPSPGGGTGGGGGGGGVEGIISLSPYMNSSGKLIEDISGNSADKRLAVFLPEDTVCKNRVGSPLASIRIYDNEEVPAAIPDNYALLGYVYDIWPGGSTFEPPIMLSYAYNPTEVPPGVPEELISVIWWDESIREWVMLDCTVDPDADTVSTEIRHLSSYAFVVPAYPASFTLSDLSITPDRVTIGEVVSISVSVTNSSEFIGTYEVNLDVDGRVIQTQEVELEGGSSQIVIFDMTADTIGEHVARIGGLEKAFEVAEAEAQQMLPSSFKVFGLTVTPEKARPSEEVTVSAIVTNVGESEGTYNVVLQLNNVEEAAQEVTLSAGEKTTVSFVVSRDEIGDYTVSIDGESVRFTVVVLPPVPESVAGLPGDVATTNWWVIIGTVVGCIILVFLGLLIIKRLKTTT